MKNIDSHVHTKMFKGIPRKEGNTTYASPEELIEMYKPIGVEKGVILPGGAVECATQLQSNEEVIALVEKYPDSFDWFCNIHPRMGEPLPCCMTIMA